MKNSLEYNYIEKYLTSIRAKGRYSFTLEEIVKEFDVSQTVIFQRLYQLKIQKKIAQIRQGFYVIVPPEYTSMGTLPTYLFLDHMMKFLGKPYYVGLLSAAVLHGAAHQKPMMDFIVSETPTPRNVKNKKHHIKFISKKTLLKEGIIQKKTQAGYINVSSPELTAFDLLENINMFGINRITTVLLELHEEMCPLRLAKIAKLVDNKSNIQRLGYILERIVEQEKLSNALYRVLKKSKLEPVSLSHLKSRKGNIDPKWKIIVNMQIETDVW